jgi:hypothetical protein
MMLPLILILLTLSLLKNTVQFFNVRIESSVSFCYRDQEKINYYDFDYFDQNNTFVLLFSSDNHNPNTPRQAVTMDREDRS